MIESWTQNILWRGLEGEALIITLLSFRAAETEAGPNSPVTPIGRSRGRRETSHDFLQIRGMSSKFQGRNTAHCR